MLLTKVNITPLKEKLTYKSNLLIIGSCFANEIGEILSNYGFNISVNPFGTLYNPASIVQSLKRLASGTCFSEKDIIDISQHTTKAENTDECTAKYCSFYHHSSFALSTPDSFLSSVNARLNEEAERFAQADTIIITLGTSWVFRHMERNFIVSNCHKINPKEFCREFLPLEDTVSLLSSFIKEHTDKRFIFTVSPIRHLKDGAHGNQISKATLLLAVEQLQQQFPENTYYFPAYEIVLDELRDYRYYAEDMLHPSGLAVKYIFEYFKGNCICSSEYQRMQEEFKHYRQTAHRTLL